MLSLSKELILELKETWEFKNGGFDHNFPVMILCDNYDEADGFALNQGWPKGGSSGIWGKSTFSIEEHDRPNEYMFVIDLKKEYDPALDNYIPL